MTDGSFIRELCLQRLPANVHLVLTSTGDKELAQVADKIVEVAVPSVSTVSVPQLTTEVKQLCADVTHLKSWLENPSLPGEDLCKTRIADTKENQHIHIIQL